TLAVMRMKKIGRELSRELARMDQWTNGGVAVRAEATGKVRAAANGEAKVSFLPTPADFETLRKGVAAYGDILLAAGAEKVSLGVPGWHEVTSRSQIESFRREGPTDSSQYEMILSHMFGTCQFGSDPEESVVGHDFEHHVVDRLFVADSSVFPSNLGVNPQISIIQFARECARSLLKGGGETTA
ncbi:MAG: GMC family oxidoreductase, partial [Bradymonadaceae bacterium]